MPGKTILWLCVFLIRIEASFGDITRPECSQKGGVMSGGRCFFIPIDADGSKTKKSWDASWVACATAYPGASLAQIHTTVEYQAIVNMLISLQKSTGVTDVNVWLALQSNPDVVNSICSITNDTTFWYDSQSQPNTAMNAGNTWIRYHSCEDKQSPNEHYIALHPEEVGRYKFYDLEGSNGAVYPLCQITNCVQTFSPTIVCIAETPILILAVSNPEECATQCSRNSWCRSFNVITNELGTTCELFSWVTTEICPVCPATKAMTGCVHYDSDISVDA